jgi:hypothetical protein
MTSTRSHTIAASHPAYSTVTRWWHDLTHFVSATMFPHGPNPLTNFLWTVLTFLTVVATIAMVAKLFRRQKGLTP